MYNIYYRSTLEIIDLTIMILFLFILPNSLIFMFCLTTRQIFKKIKSMIFLLFINQRIINSNVKVIHLQVWLTKKFK